MQSRATSFFRVKQWRPEARNCKNKGAYIFLHRTPSFTQSSRGPSTIESDLLFSAVRGRFIAFRTSTQLNLARSSDKESSNGRMLMITSHRRMGRKCPIWAFFRACNIFSINRQTPCFSSTYLIAV